jgi:hypothetical protein
MLIPILEDSFLDHFSDIEDPRKDWNKPYSTVEILLLVFCAILSGKVFFTKTRTRSR